MFGYITPSVPELKVKEHTAYRAVYCGLCKATGGGGCARLIRTPAKLALRYDTVFLALFRLMLSPEQASFAPSRCLAHPIKPRPMIQPSNHAIAYSADAGMLLFAHSLRDHAADQSGLRKRLAKCLLPYASLLQREVSARIGTELDALLTENLAALAEMEQAGEPSPDRVSHPFGVLLGEIFAYALPDDVTEPARELGYCLGKWIYLADAADDLADDRKNGAYNPLLCRRQSDCSDSSESALSPEALRISMLLLLRRADHALSSIANGDSGCRAILENILRLGLPDQTDRLIAKLQKDLI